MIKIKPKIPQRKNIFERIYHLPSHKTAQWLSEFPITANQVTLFSGLCGIAAAYLFSLGDHKYLLWGALLLQAFILLDFIDGDLARIKKRTSLFGKLLDICFDKMVVFLLFFGTSWGLFLKTRDTNVWILGLLGLGSFFGVQFFVVLSNRFNAILDGAGHPSDSKKIDRENNLINRARNITKLLNHFMIGHVNLCAIFTLSAVFNIMRIGLYFLAFYGLFCWMLLMAMSLVRIYLKERSIAKL